MPVVKEPPLDPAKLHLPDFPRIAKWDISDYTDSVGDEAIRVYVLLEPHPEGRDYRWDEVKPIEDEVFRSLRDLGETRYPYVLFGYFDSPEADPTG